MTNNKEKLERLQNLCGKEWWNEDLEKTFT